MHFDSKLAECVPPHAASVLEVGCGDRFLAARLSQRVPHVVAVDIDRPVLQRAKQRFAGIPVAWTHGDILEASERLGSFDAVVSNATLHRLPDTRVALRCMRGRASTGYSRQPRRAHALDIAVSRPTIRVTEFSHCSMRRRGRPAAPWNSCLPLLLTTFRFASASIPGSAKNGVRSGAVLRYTPVRGSAHLRARPRCWPVARFATCPPAQAFALKVLGHNNSKAFPKRSRSIGSAQARRAGVPSGSASRGPSAAR
jgi:SAM-dependent methyltransferase